MEWFWYILASIGAGVGTGLAGLSAATVMVPMLIVLCPSFSGETGALLGTGTELFTPSEYDTLTVPVAILASMSVFH